MVGKYVVLELHRIPSHLARMSLVIILFRDHARIAVPDDIHKTNIHVHNSSFSEPYAQHEYCSQDPAHLE